MLPEDDVEFTLDLEAGKFLILHVDDIGMFGSTVDAFLNLHSRGLVTSGSIMTPCSATSTLVEDKDLLNQANLDLGVHLTLTCEWGSDQWTPLSNLSFSTEPQKRSFSANPWLDDVVDRKSAIREEFSAQLKWAYENGVDVTHLDTHMLTAWHPQAIDAYVELGIRDKLPILTISDDFEDFFLSSDFVELRQAFSDQYERRSRIGNPFITAFAMMPLEDVGDRILYFEKVLKSIPDGITHFSFHPAIETAELREVAVDWNYRVADYHLLSDAPFRELLRSSGVNMMTYKYLRNRLRCSLGTV